MKNKLKLNEIYVINKYKIVKIKKKKLLKKNRKIK